MNFHKLHSYPSVKVVCVGVGLGRAWSRASGIVHDLSFYPEGLDCARQLAILRRIEDSLLKHHMNIEREVSVHFELTEAHGNDGRQLNHRCRLCVSSKVGSKSPWLQNSLSRGKVSLPLCRVRDMRVITEVSVGDPNRDLSSGNSSEPRAVLPR